MREASVGMAGTLRFRTVYSVAVLGACLATLECGASSGLLGVKDDPEDGGTDGAADVPSSDPTVTVRVYDTDPYTGVATTKPVQGAVVAADLPGGVREEKTTGASGTVEFPIDWSKGCLSVTVSVEGDTLLSVVDIAEDVAHANGDVLSVSRARRTLLPAVTVSGAIIGAAADTETHIFSTTGPSQSPLTVGEHYSIDVAPDRPFTLTVFTVHANTIPSRGQDMDLVALFGVGHAPISTDTTVDLDVQSPHPLPTKVSGTMRLPSRDDSQLRKSASGSWSTALGEVFPGGLHGVSTSVVLTASGDAFTYDGYYVEMPDVLGESCTQYALTVTPAVWSLRRKPGNPIDGDIVNDFIDLADVTGPPNTYTPWPLHSPVTFESHDDDVVPTLFVTKGGELLWWVVGAAHRASIRIPDSPSNVDEAELFGGEWTDGFLRVEAPASGESCDMRVAQMEPFIMAP